MSEVTLKKLPIVISQIDLEKGYLTAVWILSKVFKDQQFVFILSGIFFSFSVCRFIYKNCEEYVIALVMFNCLGLFNFMVQGLRQSVAMCICLFAFEQCKKEKPIAFILTVVLASLFHGSAIVFLITYILKYLKMTWKSGCFFCVVAVIAIKASDVILGILNVTMNETYTISSDSTAEGGFVAIIIYLIIIVLAILKKNLQQKACNESFDFYFYVLLVAALTFSLRSWINEIVQRISYYFMFAQIVMLPGETVIFGKKLEKLIGLFIVLLCFGIAIYKASYSVLIPYNFFWQSV